MQDYFKKTLLLDIFLFIVIINQSNQKTMIFLSKLKNYFGFNTIETQKKLSEIEKTQIELNTLFKKAYADNPTDRDRSQYHSKVFQAREKYRVITSARKDNPIYLSEKTPTKTAKELSHNVNHTNTPSVSSWSIADRTWAFFDNVY